MTDWLLMDIPETEPKDFDALTLEFMRSHWPELWQTVKKMTDLYCPKCGEYRKVELESLGPGSIIECPECKVRFRLEFEIEFDPDEENP